MFYLRTYAQHVSRSVEEVYTVGSPVVPFVHTAEQCSVEPNLHLPRHKTASEITRKRKQYLTIGSGIPGFPKTAPPITVIAKQNRIKIDRPGGNRIRPYKRANY